MHPSKQARKKLADRAIFEARLAEKRREASRLKGGIGETRHVPTGNPRAERKVQKIAAPKRRRNQKKTRPHPTKRFVSTRTASLLAIGFASYKSYLRSNLWYGIRARVLAIRSTCIRCNEPATQIHHSSYAPEVMKGTDLTHLHPVCEECHRFAEFWGDKKAPLNLANKRLGITQKFSENGNTAHAGSCLPARSLEHARRS